MNTKELFSFLESCESVLPHDAFNISIGDSELTWEMPSPEGDDASHFICWLDGESGEASWEAGNFPAGGDYYKEIKSVEEFETAIEDWDEQNANWAT